MFDVYIGFHQYLIDGWWLYRISGYCGVFLRARTLPCTKKVRRISSDVFRRFNPPNRSHRRVHHSSQIDFPW